MACMENSKFTASLFKVVFTPDNRTIHFDINGVSSIDNKNVTAHITLFAYGYKAIEMDVDPCKTDLKGFCPMAPGIIDLISNFPEVGDDLIDGIPGIAFQVPDLDGKVRVELKVRGTDDTIACVEAKISNTKTVDQKAVGFTTAIIAGMGLIASAITSGLGHDNTAAHVAANAMSLFGYFQAQAMIAMSAVALPPIVASWTQNFDWAMGLIHIDFMQKIFHWYIITTGGEPTNLLNNLDRVSINIQKRSLNTAHLVSRGLNALARRSNNDNQVSEAKTVVTLHGMNRVAFKSKIEETNLFLTGLAFFIAFIVLVALGVTLFKWGSELAIRMKWIHGSKFQEFRRGWLTVLKGIMYRLVLIGFPQMSILCIWEFSAKDSPAAVTLAVLFFFTILGILSWAAFKVIKIAQRSIEMHKNPGYILYSDPASLNRWGFLYIQFRASAYYFIVPFLGYLLLKAIFIAAVQSSGTVQAVALLVIELVFLIAVCKMKPWMDKKTNVFNISIASINTFNTVFLLVFSGIFNEPGLVKGVMGVVFFVVNAIFALVLLILVLGSSIYALYSKNPDTRYQPMRDDRSSFIKSNQMLGASTELDALGKTARGDGKDGRMVLDDDKDYAYENGHHEASRIPLPPSTANSAAPSYHENPVQPSMPYFPSNRGEARSPPFAQHQQTGPSDLPLLNPGGAARAPSRGSDHRPTSPFDPRPAHHSPSSPYQRNDNARWHVGAGYEH